MNFKITEHLDPSRFDHFISLGNRCISAMALANLGLRKEAFPFDYIDCQPEWTLGYLKDPESFLPKTRDEMTLDVEHKDFYRNKQTVGFAHFNLTDQFDEHREMFMRRFKRFHERISSERVLLVYTSEADVYNGQNSFYNDNYTWILKIQKYIDETYPDNKVEFLCIHTNKDYQSSQRIHNYTINVEERFMSKNEETHIAQVWEPYRSCIYNMLKTIFSM